MKVRVQYTAQIRTATGKSEEDIELPPGSSLAELFSHLTSRLSNEAAAHLVAAAGHTLPSLLVVVNDSAVAAREARTTMLKPGDIVTLLPPIAGG